MALPPSIRQFPGGYYRMDHEDFGKMMLNQAGLRAALTHYAVIIKGIAKANTQASTKDTAVSAEREGSSHLSQAYEVRRGPTVNIVGKGGLPGPRMTEVVVNTKSYAAVREFGAGGWQRGRGTRDLRRAGAAVGDVAGERG